MGETGVREIFFPKLPDDISEEMKKYLMELETLLADLLRPSHRDIVKTIVGEADHGLLTGLTDDDHVRYVDKDGTRAYTGTGDGFKDEDNMASDSATAVASQQSIKAYADTFAKIKTGSYTGNGAESHAITGVGFAPKYVYIFQRITTHETAVAPFMTTPEIVDDHANGGCIAFSGWPIFLIDAIISLDADGFTVDDGGDNDHPNKSTIVYNYLCIG